MVNELHKLIHIDHCFGAAFLIGLWGLSPVAVELLLILNIVKNCGYNSLSELIFDDNPSLRGFEELD